MRILLFLKVLLTFICDNVGGVACVHVEVIGQLQELFSPFLMFDPLTSGPLR